VQILIRIFATFSSAEHRIIKISFKQIIHICFKVDQLSPNVAVSIPPRLFSITIHYLHLAENVAFEMHDLAVLVVYLAQPPALVTVMIMPMVNNVKSAMKVYV